MNKALKNPPARPAQAETIDSARLEKAKDLLHCLANTVSAMKIYPSEHATVGSFVDLLARKFTAYLSAYEKLQVGIEEYSFICEGSPVFTDETAIKSLPFFFFKDGLQSLFFYQGLDRPEILEFLELIKDEVQKPAEDADFVVALWERDFPNIQYYAPDEFLENRILAEVSDSRARRGLAELPDDLADETIEVRVDTSKFTQGRIDLDQDDRHEVETAAARPNEEDGPPAPAAADPGQTAETDSSDRGQISPAAAMDPSLTESELQALEAMVRANRTISPEEEYINLMVEILYLDESADRCRASLEALLEYHFEQLRRGHFQIAVLIIQKVHELRRHLAGNAAKAALLDEFLRRTVSPETVEAVKTLLGGKNPMDWESLLGLFELLGPSSLALAADLFDIAPDDGARSKIIDFIEQAGGANPGLVAALAGSARPGLAREIIGILSRMPNNRGLAHLSAFLNFDDREIKSEAIQVLGRRPDEMANRILAGFLNDPDEGIRIQAAMALDPANGGGRIQQVLKEASGREFLAKSLKEKEALLAFLGRTRSAEALDFLRTTLERAPLLASKKVLELRLAAVAGLESAATREAFDAIAKGARSRTRKVREACQAALARRRPTGPDIGRKDENGRG